VRSTSSPSPSLLLLADLEEARPVELPLLKLLRDRLLEVELLLDLEAGAAVAPWIAAADRADGPDAFSSSRFLRSCRRRIVEFQWFLTELSVRPGNNFAISAHLLPNVA
jgi:hypothetical protein